MKKYLNFKFENVNKFLDNQTLEKYLDKASLAYDTLVNRTGLGNEFLGWLDLPETVTEEELKYINDTAKEIREKSDVLVVIGVGGSYLGAKSAIEMLRGYFHKFDTEVIFAGQNMSSTYLHELLEYLEDKDFCVNVISKSGTTTEPALAFRAIHELLSRKYKDYNSRIYATTDKEHGALREMTNTYGYKSFVIPSNVGGRYSTLTPVGLLPIAVAGFDIVKVMEGAKAAKELLFNKNENPAITYAAIRNALYDKGYGIELLVNYEKKLNSFGQWWIQLFGESEGKDGKGIYPSSVCYTTDLHALGQMVQDGKRQFFETVLSVLKPKHDIVVKKLEENKDNLNYLAGMTIDEINKVATLGTINAHVEGNVPNMMIEIPEINEYTYGYLAYFFEFACGVSAYTLGVNPFDQPGVEAYKKSMFRLLNKPGY